MSAFHSIFSGALSSLLHVHWSTVFSTTCVAAEHSALPFTSSFNSKNIGVSAIHFICSGVLSSPLHVHCGPMLFATSALEHCALCYTCRHRALFSSLGHPMQKTSECLHSTLFVVEHYGSGALCSLLYLHWSTVLPVTMHRSTVLSTTVHQSSEHHPLHYCQPITRDGLCI